MSRIKKQERQQQLREKLNNTPFVTDEELAAFFQVSVPTIRLDRLELGIPELRERIKAMAEEHSHDTIENERVEVVGELLDLTAANKALACCTLRRICWMPQGMWSHTSYMPRPIRWQKR